MNLKFDNNRRKASICPCGKSNKDGKFAPFKGFQNKGYCHACAETFYPEDDAVNFITFEPQPKQEIRLIDKEIFSQSLDDYDKNSFTAFLIKRFNIRKAEKMINTYHLGTSGEDVIFWQLDQDYNIRTGKVINYDRETGKRRGLPSWVHNYLNQTYKQCLFGLHLIGQNNKPIAIVESEKSSVIMSWINPHFNWIATGGISNLSNSRLEVIKGRELTLFPDQGAYELWDNKAKEIGLNYKISKECEYWYNDNLIDAKDDIADYYLKNYISL